MKRLFYTFLMLGFILSHAQAQRILLLPETTASTSNGMPMEMCLKHSSMLIESIESDDASAIEELRTLGYRLMRLGQHKYAKDAFDKLLEIVTQNYPKSDERYYNALLDLARVYVYLIRYDESIGMYNEVLALAEDQYGKNSHQYVLALSETTEVYFYMREADKVLANTKKIKEIEANNNRLNSNAYLAATNNLGASYKQKKNLGAAITAYEEAFKIVQNSNYPPDYEVSIAANLAEAYAWTGKMEEARNLLIKYRPLAEQRLKGKITAYARVWLQFSAAYIAVGEYDNVNFGLDK